MTSDVKRARQFASLTVPPHLGVWRTLSVVSLVVANALIVLNHDAAACATSARPGVFLGWIAAPAIAIASIATIAMTASGRSERLAAAALAPILTVAWILAVIWVSPGVVIDAVGC